MRLPPRRTSTGAVRSLREEQYWKMVFPSYDGAHHQLAQGAPDCTGRPLFTELLFSGGVPRSAWPLSVQEGDVVYGSGGDRIKVVWLLTHRWADGTEGGPLALVRAMDNYAEVYGVGVYRGLKDKTRLGVQRMGSDVLVSATEEGCVGKDSPVACRSTVHLFMSQLGKLTEAATFPTEQVDFASGNSEPGVMGRVEYRLTASPTYHEGSISVFEQVSAKDETGRELHKAELERTYKLTDGRFEESAKSLWDRLFPKEPQAKPDQGQGTGGENKGK